MVRKQRKNVQRKEEEICGSPFLPEGRKYALAILGDWRLNNSFENYCRQNIPNSSRKF